MPSHELSVTTLCVQVVEIPTGSESAGSPISTYDDPVLSVFADAMTSTGLEILDRSTGSVGRAGVSSRADGDFITKHDQWVVDVRKVCNDIASCIGRVKHSF